MVEVKENKIFVEGKETKDPLLIGYGMLDIVEKFNMKIIIDKKQQESHGEKRK